MEQGNNKLLAEQPFQFFIPDVRKNHKEVYPSQFITTTPKEYKTLTHTNVETSNKYNGMDLESYKKKFHSSPATFDLHDTNFQDLALKLTKDMTMEQLQKLSISDHADKRLIRTRVYAISSRKDLDWNGNKLTTPEEMAKKQSELDDIHTSCVLYDWATAPKEEMQSVLDTAASLKKECTFSIDERDTQRVTEVYCAKYPEKKVAYLNLANAHNTCGTYNVAFGGSQEEAVVPNSTSAVTLGTQAEAKDDMRAFFQRGEPHVMYKPGHHIPPGGNYFCKSRFVTSNPQVDCYMIGTAFADYRKYIPIYVPFTEVADYFSLMGLGSAKSENRLRARTQIDVEGICLTAVKEKIDVLILGAGGCGAFGHDPFFDAPIWAAVLQKYANCFDAVVFSIMADSRGSPNAEAFSKYFGDKQKK